MIGGHNCFDQPARNDLITYDSIQKIAIGEGDDYTNGYLLDYNYIKNYYKIIAIDLSTQQILDADPKAIQQISFTRNLARAAGEAMFFIIQEAKRTVIDF